MVIPLMPQHGRIQTVPLGLFPTYCFDPQLPALRASSSFGSTTTEFNNIVKAQNRYLSREILILEGKSKILSATVDLVTWLDPADPALKPATEVAVSDVKKVNVADVKKVNIAAGIAVGSLLKKEIPVYPQDAKDAHASGTVVLRAQSVWMEAYTICTSFPLRGLRSPHRLCGLFHIGSTNPTC
jgi:hypothetical protein